MRPGWRWTPTHCCLLTMQGSFALCMLFKGRFICSDRGALPAGTPCQGKRAPGNRMLCCQRGTLPNVCWAAGWNILAGK